jgi:hypothetical protein
MGLIESRRGLQAIKHADIGGSDELDQLRKLMSGVEGFFTYAVRMGWNKLDDRTLEDLRAQMDGTASRAAS